MGKRLTTEDFINRSKEVHGDRYDYSLSEYKSSKTLITIICKEHGDFTQNPDNHFQGKGCPKCRYISSGRNKSICANKKRNWNFKQPEEYKLIPLTKGKFAKVDNEDFDLLKSINWKTSSNGYALNSIHGLMHRVIMNTLDNNEIDHVNHDTLDNRRFNLRVCNSQENKFNQRSKNTRTSKYKGVCFCRKSNMFVAQITFNYKRMNLGYYKEDKEAAKAYDKKAKELFGEFAYLNFK